MRRYVLALALVGVTTALACNLLPSVSDVLNDNDPTAEQQDTPTPQPTGESQGVTAPVADSDLPAAVIDDDEGGPELIQGAVTYTNLFFTEGVAQPLVILEDQTGFVHRDEDYIIPVESQTLGHITSDFMESPFTYTISLPIEPEAPANDVDNDGEEDPGVMVYAVAYWDNVFGDPYLQERDLGGGGWSTAYASTRASEDYETEREIIGGKLLVYALADGQGFPSEFGPDGLLFTEDDPIVALPQGYTVVNLDVEPFTFNRAREQTIDLIEPEGSALEDFSGLGYTEAFDQMVDLFRTEYAFTDYKGIDWDALQAEYRPRFEDAERNRSAIDYRRALQDFLAEIPDGHVSGPLVVEDFQQQYGGGLGMAIRETDDGEVFVTYVLPGGPAETLGIEVGAELVALNGEPVGNVIDATDPNALGPQSSDHNRFLARQAFAVRFPLGSVVEVTFQNPGEAGPSSDTISTLPEFDSLFVALYGEDPSEFSLPVEYHLLDSGYAYVKIFSFFDNKVLTIELWDRLMGVLNEQGVPGLIIDMRQNGGGWGFMADQMAAYFFNEPLVLGNSGHYDESLGDFYFDPDTQDEFILAPENLRYNGDVVVLISPDCASACEFFSYDMTLQDRATVIGHYPTAGLGGGVEDIAMPEDETVRMTVARAVDADGNIHIEGKGVPPDIRVPVTEETLFGSQDALLQAAVDYLNGQ